MKNDHSFTRDRDLDWVVGDTFMRQYHLEFDAGWGLLDLCRVPQLLLTYFFDESLMLTHRKLTCSSKH